MMCADNSAAERRPALITAQYSGRETEPTGAQLGPDAVVITHRGTLFATAEPLGSAFCLRTGDPDCRGALKFRAFISWMTSTVPNNPFSAWGK